MKKYKTQFTRATEQEVTGAGKRAEIHTTYQALAKTFGSPDAIDPDEKVQAEWRFNLGNGKIVTIHDYKDRLHYTNVTNWSIGGKNIDPHEITDAICDRIEEVNGGRENARITKIIR